MASKTSQGNCNSDYFRLPYPIPVLILFVFWSYQGMVTFSPNELPDWLWLLGPFGKYMGTNFPNFMIFSIYATIALHTFETMVTWTLCRRRHFTMAATYKWTVSTFIFGYLSLYLLRQLHPRQSGYWKEK